MKMHGLLILAAGLLIAAEPPKKPAKPAPVERETVRYTIEIMVVKVDANGRDFGADGKGKLLAEPRLVVAEGKSGQFLAGGQAPLPGQKGREVVSMVPFGTTLNLKVTTLADNRMRLEASLGQSSVENSGPSQLTIVGRTVHAVFNVELGETAKLAVKDDQGEITHWAKVRVAEKEEATIKQFRAPRDTTEKKPVKVGEIKIVGNTTVSAETILRQVPCYPGGPLEYPTLHLAERNLARLNLFRVDPAKGVRPTVTVVNPEVDRDYKDLLITVEEKAAEHRK